MCIYITVWTYGCIFKVVQAFSTKNEPSSLPVSNATSYKDETMYNHKKLAIETIWSVLEVLSHYPTNGQFASFWEARSEISIYTLNHRYTLFPKPPFFIWIEESIVQIVTIIFRNFEWLFLDRFKNTLKGKCFIHRSLTGSGHPYLKLIQGIIGLKRVVTSVVSAPVFRNMSSTQTAIQTYQINP